jgi:hypothetical protein
MLAPVLAVLLANAKHGERKSLGNFPRGYPRVREARDIFEEEIVNPTAQVGINC